MFSPRIAKQVPDCVRALFEVIRMPNREVTRSAGGSCGEVNALR
jgi:hypothetical protein